MRVIYATTKRIFISNLKTIIMGYVRFNKVNESYGMLGNMYSLNIIYDGKNWSCNEKLFLSLRFRDEEDKEFIRNFNGSIIILKRIVKGIKNGWRDKMVVELMGKEDVENMKKVVRLKYNSYEWIRKDLRRLKGEVIYEDVINRKRGSGVFWGGYIENGKLIGENILGKIWMGLRDGDIDRYL